MNGYCILTMQNTVGKLMERFVARKLARDLKDREILSANGVGVGGSDQENACGENAAAFTYDVYKGFQRKEQTVAVAIDLKDAHNRVQFKLLMNRLIQYGNLTLNQWVAGALMVRTVVMQLGNWSSAPHQLTMGLPQGSPLLPVLFNVYTKGLADLNQNGPSKTGLYTKHLRTPRRQPKQCNNNWKVYSSGVMTPDLSSIQRGHKHCGSNSNKKT